MPRATAKKTIGLPMRLGRFLGRKLDPRRKASLEDSLRIRASRWEERQHSLEQRSAGREEKPNAGATEAESPRKTEERKSSSVFDGWLDGVLDLVIGDAVIGAASKAAGGVVRLIGGVLEGLLDGFDV